MKMPDHLDRCILILALRSAACSQDAVASMVRCHKLKVGQVERWFSELPWREAKGVCEEQAVKKIMERDLPSLEEIDEKVVAKAEQITGDHILRYFREDYVVCSLEKEPRQEKLDRHQELMIQLAERWKGELRVALWQDIVRDLGGPGTHYGEKDIVWQISEDGKTYLSYPLEVSTDMESRLIFTYLKEHLETSDLSWFFEELTKWMETGGTELSLRSQLLDRVDEIAEKKTGKRPRDCTRQMDAGLCHHFSDSILAIVVDDVYRKLTYQPVEQSQGGLYFVRYGAMVIGLATSRKKARRYQQVHRDMIAALETDDLVQELRGLKRTREASTLYLQEELTKLVLAGFVSGSCELCRPA